MKLKTINPITLESWDELVLGLPDASFFYSSSWAKVLSETYGYTPTYFVLSEGEDLRYVLPMMGVRSWLTGARGVSIPFSDYSAPFPVADEGGAELFDEVVLLGRELGWRSVEFRGGGAFFEGHQPSQAYLIHTLELGEENDLFNNLKRSTRKNIKHAEKAGVEVDIGNSSEAMEEFYRLNCLTRRKHGLPPQPYRFFEKLQTHVLLRGLGEISLARWHGKAVAASLFFRCGNQVMYKYTASDPDHLPLRANNLVAWEAIRYYTARGGKTMDFGKTATNNEGLRRYKLGWGAHEQSLKYYRYNLRRDEFEQRSGKEAGWHTSVFSKMPMPLLVATGRLIYRHIG